MCLRGNRSSSTEPAMLHKYVSTKAQNGQKKKPRQTMAPHRAFLPANTISPIRLVGRDVFSWLRSETSPLEATKSCTLDLESTN